MTTQFLNQDQRETLQEVTNIAMGQAGSTLAQLLGVFVKLSVPQINFVEMNEINQALAMIVGNDTIVSAVRQAYSGPIRGEAIAIFDDRGHEDLADLMGYDDELTPETERELLLDTANLLIGACQTGIARLLNMEITFAPPALLAQGTPIGTLIQSDNSPDWKFALVIEVNFALEARNFTCHLTQLMPESSLVTLREALDLFLESL